MHRLLDARRCRDRSTVAPKKNLSVSSRVAGSTTSALPALGEVADAPVDLAQALLAVLVVGVLAAVAELGGHETTSRSRRGAPSSPLAT